MTFEAVSNDSSTKDNIIVVGEDEPQARAAPQGAVPRQPSDQQIEPSTAENARAQASRPAEDDEDADDTLDDDEADDTLPEFRAAEFFDSTVGASLSLEALQTRMSSLLNTYQDNQVNISNEDEYVSEVDSLSNNLDLIQQAMNKLDQETSNLQSRFRQLLNTIVEDRNQ